MEEILRRASDVSTRCNRQSVVLEDVLFVVRKSPIRVQRLARYAQSLNLNQIVCPTFTCAFINPGNAHAHELSEILRLRDRLSKNNTTSILLVH